MQGHFNFFLLVRIIFAWKYNEISPFSFWRMFLSNRTAFQWWIFTEKKQRICSRFSFIKQLIIKHHEICLFQPTMYWDGVYIVSLHFNPNCPRWFFLIHNTTLTIKQQKPGYSEWWDIFTRMQNTLLEKAVSAAQQLNAASAHKRVSVSIAFAEGEAILVGSSFYAVHSPKLDKSRSRRKNLGKWLFLFPLLVLGYQNYFLLVLEYNQTRLEYIIIGIYIYNCIKWNTKIFLLK